DHGWQHSCGVDAPAESLMLQNGVRPLAPTLRTGTDAVRKGSDPISQGAPMTLKIDGTLLLAGAGNMGAALLAGWLERGLSPARILVQDPAPPPSAKMLLDRHGIAAHATVGALPSPPA